MIGCCAGSIRFAMYISAGTRWPAAVVMTLLVPYVYKGTYLNQSALQPYQVVHEEGPIVASPAGIHKNTKSVTVAALKHGNNMLSSSAETCWAMVPAACGTLGSLTHLAMRCGHPKLMSMASA
jgi:hypothetical protein